MSLVFFIILKLDFKIYSFGVYCLSLSGQKIEMIGLKYIVQFLKPGRNLDKHVLF